MVELEYMHYRVKLLDLWERTDNPTLNPALYLDFPEWVEKTFNCTLTYDTIPGGSIPEAIVFLEKADAVNFILKMS